MAADIPLNQAPKWVSPMPTPTYGAGGSTTIVFGATITASPAVCLEVILDYSSYPSWNRFCQHAAVDSTPTPDAKAGIPAALAALVESKPDQQYFLPGTKFHFNAHMDPDTSPASFRRVDLVVSVLEEFERDGRKGLRVAWRSSDGTWGLRAERVQEFLETDAGDCEYRNYETFFGVLAWAPKMFVGGKLERVLGMWRDGLKKEAEARSKNRKVNLLLDS